MCSGNMSTSWTKNHRNMDVHLLSLLKLLLRTLSPETLPLLVNIVYACCNTVMWRCIWLSFSSDEPLDRDMSCIKKLTTICIICTHVLGCHTETSCKSEKAAK